MIIIKTGDKNPKRAKDGITPLIMAAQEGHVEVFEFLSSNLKDKNPVDHKGWTPFHWAALNGRLDICSLIIETLEDKNPGDNNGGTPLHLAAKNGHLNICSLRYFSLVALGNIQL